MARRFYQMVIGMKEHPETGVLLYPGDIFEVEDTLIERMPQDGGWKQCVQWDDSNHQHIPLRWEVICAKPVDATQEALTQRDEPSKVIGINISEKAYLRDEVAAEARAAVIGPALPAAKNAPASVQRRAPGGKR